MKTFTFKILNLFFFLSIFTNLQSATYRNYVSHEMINSTTLRIWINSDTALGEKAIAEARWDTGGGNFNYSGLIDGTYDTNTPGANWRVDLTIPSSTNIVDYQLGNRNQSNNIYGLTNFVGNTLTGLPVKFINFKATNSQNHNILSWQTATENNNSHFDIQRSIDSKTWLNIGRIEGNGTSTQIQSYSFADKAPLFHKNYYRLKQIDYDGSFRYSIIVVLSNKKHELTFSPNPVRDFVEVNFSNFKDGSIYTIQLINAQGQLINKSISVSSSILIDMNQYPSGLYSIRIYDQKGNILDIKQLSKL